VSWPVQSGASGYQVFRSDSPWNLVVTLGGEASSYVDEEGSNDSLYLVTAYAEVDGAKVGEVSDPNTDEVPGLGLVESNDGGQSAPVPGFSLVLLLGGLAAALVVARRRV